MAWGFVLVMANIWITYLITMMFINHQMLYDRLIELFMAVLGIIFWITIAAPMIWRLTFKGMEW